LTESRKAPLGQPSLLGPSTIEQAVVCAVFLVVGAGLGWVLKLLASWLVTLPWAPMQGPAELLTSIPDPWLTVVLVTIGGIGGLVAGLAVQQSELKARISGSGISLTRGDETQEIPGADIALVFQEDKVLVVLGRSGRELASEKSDLDGKRVAEAVTGHGYAWADEDPHKDEFRPWVPDTPGLPEGANALLKARSHVLKKKDSGEELRELWSELAKLGLVVRDKKGRQYWRTARTSS
jgi:hypothetical protein